MAERELEKSPHWDEQVEREGFRRDGFPFDEGFPQRPVGRVYEIIERDGIKSDAIVDLSRQYRNEGIEWQTLGGRNIYRHVVVGWREKPQEQ